jgi:hypothetical protein
VKLFVVFSLIFHFRGNKFIENSIDFHRLPHHYAEFFIKESKNISSIANYTFKESVQSQYSLKRCIHSIKDFFSSLSILNIAEKVKNRLLEKKKKLV